MMFFTLAFQLCWTVIAIISFVRGQQLDQNTATATANIPISTPNKVVDSRGALVARWTDVMSTLICSDCLLTFGNRKTITTETLTGEHQ
jgi:FAD synthase